MIKRYNFDENEFINKYNELRSANKVAKYYGCNKTTILNYAHKIGYKNDIKKLLSIEDKEQIVLEYDKSTSAELAKRYNVSQSYIIKCWHDYGLSGKAPYSYPFDYNYFNTIDTPEKAYFLGWLASDGNVYKRPNQPNQAMIKINLKENDSYILELLKLLIGSEKPLISRNATISDGTTSTYKTLELVSDIMAEDLRKYNIVPNKTHTYEMVDLGDELNSHFLRGYYDGDGGCTVRDKNYFSPSCYNFYITGFKHNLDIMQSIFLRNNINLSYLKDSRKYTDGIEFGCLRPVNIEEKYKFITFIYKDCDIYYLHRKKYLADCFVSAMKHNWSNKQNIYNKAFENAVSDETNK